LGKAQGNHVVAKDMVHPRLGRPTMHSSTQVSPVRENLTLEREPHARSEGALTKSASRGRVAVRPAGFILPITHKERPTSCRLPGPSPLPSPGGRGNSMPPLGVGISDAAFLRAEEGSPLD